METHSVWTHQIYIVVFEHFKFLILSKPVGLTWNNLLSFHIYDYILTTWYCIKVQKQQLKNWPFWPSYTFMPITQNYVHHKELFSLALKNQVIKIHALRVPYAHAAANLNSGYSKYAKVACVHYLCTIALRTSCAVHEHRVGLIYFLNG